MWKSSICPTLLVSLEVWTRAVICMITRASFISGIESQILSTSICIFCFSSITFCSQSVWRSLVCFHFLSSYAGLDCTICWSAICFLIYIKFLIVLQNLFLLKLFGIGNYLILILSVDWERVWSNLSLTSKNLAHRLIHFKSFIEHTNSLQKI